MNGNVKAENFLHLVISNLKQLSAFFSILMLFPRFELSPSHPFSAEHTAACKKKLNCHRNAREKTRSRIGMIHVPGLHKNSAFSFPNIFATSHSSISG